MARGDQRFVRQQIDRTAEQTVEAKQAVVTGIATGAGTDGLDVVTIRLDGATQKVPHLSSYTPVLNHVVAVVPYTGTWLVLGRPVGFPTGP